MTTSTSFAQMANNQSISLSSALRANTPPTKGQTTSRKFLTLSIFFRLLLVMFLTLTASTAWGADTWELVTDYTNLSTSDVYVIAGNIKGGSTWYALKNNEVTTASNLPCGSTLTISNQKITSSITENDTWVVETTSTAGVYYIKSTKGAYYLQNAGATGSKITSKSSTDKQNQWRIHYAQTLDGNTVTGLYNVGVSRELGCYNSTTWRCYTTSNYANLKDAEVCLYRKVASCDKKVTVNMGTPSNGSFSISKTGTYETCAAPLVITLSNITPSAGYQFGAITQTGIGTGVTIDQANKTVTYAKNTSGTSTINVTFEQKQSATITLSEAGVETGVTGKYVGDSYTLPSTTSQSCGDLEFVGWSTVEINNSASKPASNYYDKGASVTLAANQTFHAVFAKETTTNSGNIETTITIPNETLIRSLSESYGNKSFSYEGYTFNLNACVQSDYCQMRDNNTISFIQIPTLPGPITKISCTDCKNASGSAYSGTLHFKSSKTRGNSDTDDIDKITYASVNSFEWKIDNDTHKTGYLLTSAGLRLKNLSITYITSGETITYSDYTTSCTTEPSQLATPTNLQVTNITSSSATLSWDAVANANGYEIKKGNSSIASTGTTSYDLSKLEPSTEYTYCVYAVADGYTNSDETCVTFTTATAPAANVVNWVVKGENKTTAFNGQSTAIYQLTDDESKCGEKKFVGWTATKNYENATTAPNDLFTNILPDGVTESTTFYAVYADTRTTTSITYTWDMVKQSTTPALAAGDQIVITAKNANYALSTTQNTYNRGAVEITKHATGDSITINPDVQILTLGVGSESNTFTLSPTTMYLMAGKTTGSNTPYLRLSNTKNQSSAWTIGFTDEKTPYIYAKLYEAKGKGNKKQYYYYYISYTEETELQWNWEIVVNRYFTTKRADNNTRSNPKNISIYRKTQHTTEKTTTSGYTTNCGCSEPQTPLSINDEEVVVNTELDLAEIYYTGGTGGRIYEYYCSDAAHTTIANGHIFSANALGTYTITATQEANNGACETTATFTITVTCATPSISITPPTYETTINTPVDLKSIIKSTSPMPLTFACTDENVYISGTNFTFLAAGTYTITAKQEAGGIYCNGSQEITITVTDPCKDKTKPTVNATAITTDKFTLSWSTIAGVSTYRIYNNTTGDSDETPSTSYTFSGLNPSTEYSWTVEAVYSDGCTAATSGTTTTSTPEVTYTVNWYVAGEPYTTYGGSTSVSHGEKVSDLSDDPNPAEHSCDGKAFVGWSKSQFVDGTRPADLFTTAAGSPAITAATTFYAVFADCVTGGDTPEDDTQGEWTLVTDMSVLEVGTKIFIAAANEDVALSTTQKTNNRDATSIIKSGNTATIDETTQVLTLETGTKSGTWAFNTGDGYLYAASSGSNYLRTIAELDDNGSWTISVTNTGIATIKAQGSNTRNWLRKNSNSALFSCYSSGQDDVVIYYKSGSSSGGGETPEPEVTITWMVNGEETIGDAPASPTSDCGTFIGWTTSEINGSSITQPATLYATANDCPKNVSTTYYAVFEITTGGGESTTETYTFSGYCENEEDATKYVYGVEDTYDVEFYQGTGSNPPMYYSNGTAMRIYKGNYMTIQSASSITSIEFEFSGTNKAFTVDGGNYSDGIWSGSATSVKFTNNSTEQIRIISVTVTIGGGTTTYVTTCPGGSGGSGEGGGVDSNTEVFSDQLNFDTDGTSITNRDGWSSLTTAYSYKSGSQSGIRIASGDNAGSITTNPLTNVNGTNATLRVEFDAVGWDSDEKILSVSATNGTASPTSFELANSKGSTAYTASDHYSFTITGASSSTQVKWSAAGGKRAIIANVVITQLSTPASAPARKVAMKKAAAKAAKKAGMARPVVKAPAALAAQECTSYENYTTICCANPITDLKFAAGANSITLYWNTAAASATATLYNDEECTNQVTDATQSGITNGTCTFTGLAKTTTYYAKVTTADGCTAVLEVSTERPIVSVAEWAATQINIDINTNEPIRVYLENEVTGGSTSGNQATELFFSKYYEATANVKLVAVYNGTPDAINLSTYTIQYGKTAWATNYIPLAEFATTANGFALEGYLSPGEEMILYTKNVSDGRDVAIMECVNEAYPDGKWIEVTTTNNTGKGSLSFGGDKVIALFEGSTLIDIIGAGNADAPTISGSSMTKPSWGDAKGWTCDEGLSIDDGTMIGISTNRCLLVRNNTVTSGANAVSQNTSDFVTLCTEWKGAHVPDDDIDDGVAASCENFAFVGTFDYSDYYVKYEELATSDELPADGRLEDGTYKVTTPNLHDIACTNMRISVKSATDGTTLVTQDYKVPIIVDQDIQTDNEIYFQYTQRTDVNVKPDLGDKNENVLTPDICAECDIVIRDSKTLTHVEGGKGQFRNMMVYPNAKMDNKAAKPFNLNTLQMQGQNDAVSYAIIENDGSTIDVGDMVFVKRIDDKYWYNFSLPYDCKVADIIQQNGQSMGKYWVDWGIKEYDGKARQEGGNSAGAGNVGLYWKKVEETATLKAHQGYIIGLFTTEWTNQMKFVYFTPTNTNPYRESGNDAKNTTIDSWYTSKTVAARHRGWNFTGSPYISRFGQSTAGQGLNNTSLIMTGHPEPENNNVTEYETYTENVYVTIPSTQGGKYYSHSVASGVELLPFTAYFVQAADVEGSTDTPRTLTYAKGKRALPTSAPARTPAATKQRVLAELLVTAPDGQTDNTGVWVDECYTPEYEIAADLGKMYVAGAKPQLYTLAANGDMMAYHALPDASAINIPLRLYAPKAGDYTLTLNQRVSRLAGAERVELLYNNAVVANMMLQDYTITANRGTVNGYSLSITRRADVSTAIDNITGTAITVIANDGYISVTDIPTDAQVSVYDMLGRLLATQSANGQTVVNIPAVPQGVYNIVVGNNNGHTTIKTVIK